MFLIVEIILISLIVLGAIIYFIWHLRKELKGESSCGNECSSCKIRENCSQPESSGKTGKANDQG